MQCGFLVFGTTDATFIMRRQQDKYLVKRRYLNLEQLENLYLTLADLEKAFDSVSRKVMWWAMIVVGMSEWIMTLIKAMYSNSKARFRVDCEYSDVFSVTVDVH